MKRTVAIMLVLVTMLTACASIEDELAEDFTQSITSEGNAYWSTRSVAAAGRVVASKQKPLDIHIVGSAQFLQYSDAIVAIWDCGASDTEMLNGASAELASTGVSDQQMLSSAREGCLQNTGAVLYVDEYARTATVGGSSSGPGLVLTSVLAVRSVAAGIGFGK